MIMNTISEWYYYRTVVVIMVLLQIQIVHENDSGDPNYIDSGNDNANANYINYEVLRI